MIDREILAVLPEPLRTELEARGAPSELRELRLRNGRRTELNLGEKSLLLSYRASERDLRHILEYVSGYSLYRIQDQLRNGFCTTGSGGRIGVCGNVVRNAAGEETLEQITSLNLRFPFAAVGYADRAIRALREDPASVLILGAPGCGKTTLLRDLIRQISDRLEMRVSVADERFELGGMENGRLCMDLGERTDVLSGGEKDRSMMQLLRAMTPQWIAVDEITSAQDVEALERCSYCGVRLLATAHAEKLSDLFLRPVYQRMMEKRIFSYFIEMQPDGAYRVKRAGEVYA